MNAHTNTFKYPDHTFLPSFLRPRVGQPNPAKFAQASLAAMHAVEKFSRGKVSLKELSLSCPGGDLGTAMGQLGSAPAISLVQVCIYLL